MAYVTITKNPGWQYNNSPADPGVGHPHRPLWQKQTNGIRTTDGHAVYTEVRRTGTTAIAGEISKTYWDAT